MNLRIILIAPLLLFANGCVLTKVVTVPMRMTGAVVSTVPVVGNPVDGVIDGTADLVDKVPL